MTRYFIACIALLAAACSDGSSSQELRGALGKADAFGSCQDSCGDQSADGDCYCDDICEAYGDCCSDKAEVCESTAVICGGLLGGQCGDDEYCHFEEDAICGAADATGVCLPRPDACIQAFVFVCGCDDQTYDNECEAHAAGVSVVHQGECAPPVKSCGSRGLPECGEGEFCSFDTEAQCGRADAPGVCAPRPEACTQQYDPVCGCDGQTYGNACTASVAGVSVDHGGICAEFCGGFGNLPCSDSSKVCVDAPGDGCNPDNGGADCGGICVDP